MKIKRLPSDGRQLHKGKVDAPPVARVTTDEEGWIHVHVAHIAAPQGSHRQGFGKSVKETNPRTEPYRQAVADAIEAWHDEHQLGEPLLLGGHLEAAFRFHMPPPPKSDPDRPYPNTAPDIDKLIRSTFDGITRGKLWEDDARVVRLAFVEELFAASLEETGVDIYVRKMPGT